MNRYTAPPTNSVAKSLFTVALITLVVSSAICEGQAGQRLRVATFNVSLAKSGSGVLANLLNLAPNNFADQDIRRIAEVIQRINPDVILINEFDYDASGNSATDFINNFLNVSQNGLDPIDYDFVFNAPSNTGIQPEDVHGPSADFDFDRNGFTDQENDAFGFGLFPGQFGMLILSRVPIDTGNARTFQKFLWEDMPGALLPDDPNTVGTPGDWYSPAQLDIFRLSSKSHWDVPVTVEGETIHLLASHPTPPVFDGVEDRNGLRNHDEIRFWSDYITPGSNSYIYDDDEYTAAGEQTPVTPDGGFTGGEKFVILGDQNADPDEGDSSFDAALQLTNNPNINNSFVPTGDGGPDSDDTAEFNGGLRVDYVLPSTNLTVEDTAEKTGVFWPTAGDPQLTAANESDHRLVFVDFVIGVIGDLDTDSDVDAEDIDLLYDSFNDSNIRKFDLNEDGDIDPNDVAFQVQSILNTEFGDADLDGDVDGADFLAIQRGLGTDAGWAGGDFDGSGLVDSGDIAIWQANYGFSASVDSAAEVVPEPCSFLIAAALLSILTSGSGLRHPIGSRV